MKPRLLAGMNSCTNGSATAWMPWNTIARPMTPATSCVENRDARPLTAGRAALLEDVPGLRGVEAALLLLPAGDQRVQLLLPVGLGRPDPLQALLAGRVLFFLQRLSLHFQLHDLALDHMDFDLVDFVRCTKPIKDVQEWNARSQRGES